MGTPVRGFKNARSTVGLMAVSGTRDDVDSATADNLPPSLRWTDLLLRHPSSDSAPMHDFGRWEDQPHQHLPAARLATSPWQGLLIADEVGLGKTISAIRIIRRLHSIGETGAIIIACPGSLRSKWKQELHHRGDLEAEIIDSGRRLLRVVERLVEGEPRIIIVSHGVLRRSATLEQLMAKAKEDENISELPILVKADVQGSAEAIVQAMEKIGNDEVRVRVLHYGVGAITETDVGLAEASGAPVTGFNVRANASARNTANQKGVEIRYYSVIYDLVDDVKAAASGLLSAEVRENFIGYSEIKEIFKVSGVGKVAGCIVTEGVARRSAGVRLIRDSVVIHEGTLKTLKRFKDEVGEVQSGQECGMAFENYEDLKQGDVIECYEVEEIARTLDDVN